MPNNDEERRGGDRSTGTITGGVNIRTAMRMATVGTSMPTATIMAAMDPRTATIIRTPADTPVTRTRQ